MSESRQHWLDRNRPPRVQITYDVETLGSSAKQEIPFVAGVMGDFGGATVQAAPLADRRFVEIDRDNFEKVMSALKATIQVSGLKLPKVKAVGNTYTVDAANGTPVTGTLAIDKLDDFGPRRILEQLGAANADVKKMLDDRQALADLLVKVQADDSITVSITTSLTSPAVLDTAFAALTAANAQAAKVTAALGVFAKGATDPNFNTAKFETDDAALVDAVLPIAAKAGTAFGTAFTDAGKANDARIAAEQASTNPLAPEQTVTDKQVAAATAFQAACTALDNFVATAGDASNRLVTAGRNMVVPSPDPDGRAALKTKAQELAATARNETDALAELARTADSAARSAATRFPPKQPPPAPVQ
ncbi:MAG TPA: type VI secretion system contractile sheath small subunit [Longimicrobium sp.]|nr:type VI secretion system contractile sheath small subunit [Longimicrobium sp.]